MSETKSYLAYGVQLECDVDLSRQLVSGGQALHKLTIGAIDPDSLFQDLEHINQLVTSHGRSLRTISDRPFGPTESGQRWQFEIADVVTFQWISGKPEIVYLLGAEGNDELLAFWLIHIFLPIYLSLEADYDFLHAGAVDVDGHTIMFIAPSMGGKSTLTEYFIRQGHALVSDDKVATIVKGDRYIAVPSHANYRPYRSFEDLGFKASKYRSEPQVIHAFYLLQREAEADSIEFTEIKGFRKFEHLLPNYLFGFAYLKKRRMEYLARLVNSVPVYAVKLPDDLARLGEVYEAICEHCRAHEKDVVIS